MPKVSVKPRPRAKAVALPEGYSGTAGASAFFGGERDKLHLHLFELGHNELLRIEAAAIDKTAYVWRGKVSAGGHDLAAGSSLIVEHGRSLDLVGAEGHSVVLAFSAARPPVDPLPGGNVHLLPADRAPQTDSLGGRIGLGGVMHADADCPTCEIWLHGNTFQGREAPPAGDQAGVHSHSEDEIIFVVDGEIRLGTRLYGPGTALAIAADTLYSFTPGPKGLSFINFRAGKPGDIQSLERPPMSETAYWRERLPRPDYVSPET